GMETLNTDITLGAAQTFTVANTGATLTMAGVLSGAASADLAKEGPGTLALNRPNTFAGGGASNAGTLSLGNSSTLGTGNLPLNGGTFSLNSGISNPFTVGGPVSVVGRGGGMAYLGGPGVLAAGGTLTVNGGVVIGGNLSGPGALLVS